MKVTPEWFAGDLSPTLQKSYDNSTDGSILIDATRGSVDIKGATGTWDAHLLTLGFTGENPTTVLTAVNSVLSAKESSVSSSLNSVVVGGFSGVVEGYSDNSFIMGGSDNLATEVSTNSGSLASNRTKLYRANNSAFVGTGGDNPYYASQFYTPSGTYMSSANSWGTYSGLEYQSQGAPAGYSGISTIKGLDADPSRTGAPGPIASHRVTSQGSSSVYVEGAEDTSINSSKVVHIDGTHTVDRGGDLYPVLIKNVSVDGSVRVSVRGFADQVSVSSSYLSGVVGDTKDSPARQVNLSGVSSSLVKNSVLVNVAGSDAVVVDGGNPNGSFIASKQVDVGGSYRVQIYASDKVSVKSSAYVVVGSFSDYQVTGTSTVESVDVTASVYVKVDRASLSSVISSANVTLQNHGSMDTNRAFVAASYGVGTAGAQTSAIIASSDADSPNYGAYVNIDDSARKYISLYRVRSCLIASSSTAYGGSPDRSPRIGYSDCTSIISCTTYMGSSTLPLGGVDEGTGATGAANTVLSSSANVISYGARNTFISSSDGVRSGHSYQTSISSSSSLAAGYLVPGFTGLAQEAFAVFDFPIINYVGQSGVNYANHRCSVSATHKGIFFGNNNSVMHGGDENIMAPWSNNSTMHGGVSNIFFNSDRSSLSGGIKVRLGPWSHDTVAGGGYDTVNSEVVKSVSFANSSSSFRKTSSGALLAATSSSTNRTVNPAIISSERVDILESTEGLGLSSEDVSISGSFRSGAILSKNSTFQDTNNSVSLVSNTVQMDNADLSAAVASASVIVTGDTTYFHTSASSQSSADNSDHVDIVSSHGSEIVDSSRTFVAGSYNALVLGSVGTALVSAYNTTVHGGSSQAVMAAQSITLTRADRAFVGSSEYLSVTDSNNVSISATRSSGLSSYSHFSSLVSSAQASIDDSEYSVARSSFSVSLSANSNYTVIDSANGVNVYNSPYCRIGNSSFGTLYSANDYTSVDNSLYFSSTGNHYSRVDATLQATAVFNHQTSINSSRRTLAYHLGASLIASSEDSEYRESERLTAASNYNTDVLGTFTTAVVANDNGHVTKVNESIVVGNTYTTVRNTNQSLVAAGTTNTVDFSNLVSLSGTSNSVMSNSNRVLLSSTNFGEIANSVNVSMDSSDNSMIVSNSSTASVKSSLKAQVHQSYYTSVDSSMGNSKDSYGGVRVMGSSQASVRASGQYTEIIDSHIVSHSAGSHNWITNAEYSSMEACYSSTIDSANGVFLVASSLSYVKEESHNSVISASYNSSVSGQSVNATIDAGSDSSISQRSHSSSISNSSEATVSGQTVRAGVRNSENVTVTGQAHRTSVESSRNVFVGSYSEGSSVRASENVTLVNASRSTEVSSSRNAVVTGSEMAAQIASEGCLTKDAPNSVVIASRDAKATHQGELVRANGSYFQVGEAQTSNLILRSIVSEDDQELFLDGATGTNGTRIGLQPNSTYSVRASVVAKGATGGVGAVRHFEGMFTTDDNFIHTDTVHPSFTGCSADTLMQDTSVAFGATGLIITVEAQGATGTSYSGMETIWMADLTLTKISY